MNILLKNLEVILFTVIKLILHLLHMKFKNECKYCLFLGDFNPTSKLDLYYSEVFSLYF